MQNKPKKRDKKIFCHIIFTHLFFIFFACAILGPHRRTPKLRVRPGNRGFTPHIYHINWVGLVRASGFRSVFRRPAMWAQQPTEGPSTDKAFCMCDKWKVPKTKEINLCSSGYLPSIWENFTKIWTILWKVLCIWKNVLFDGRIRPHSQWWVKANLNMALYSPRYRYSINKGFPLCNLHCENATLEKIKISVVSVNPLRLYDTTEILNNWRENPANIFH
jgi:hypothetical protein